MKKYTPSVKNNNQVKDELMQEMKAFLYRIEKGKYGKNLDKDTVKEVYDSLANAADGLSGIIFTGDEDLTMASDKIGSCLANVKKALEQDYSNRLVEAADDLLYYLDSFKAIADGEIDYIDEEEITSLSALAKKLLHRDCGVQGTLHFSYKGEVLSALRKRLEDEGQYRENEPIDTHMSFPDKDNGDDKNGISLYFTTDKYTATCVWNDDEFLLLKDSKLSISNSKSCPNAIVKMREEKSTIINGERVLSEDILFTSSSAAAKFVAGSSVSGNVCWKNADGILLKSLQK